MVFNDGFNILLHLFINKAWLALTVHLTLSVFPFFLLNDMEDVLRESAVYIWQLFGLFWKVFL